VQDIWLCLVSTLTRFDLQQSVFEARVVLVWQQIAACLRRGEKKPHEASELRNGPFAAGGHQNASSARRVFGEDALLWS
jgi:hypothetical protein